MRSVAIAAMSLLLVMPAAAQPTSTSDADFNALMAPQSQPVPAVTVTAMAPWTQPVSETSAAVAVPLSDFQSLWARTQAIATSKTTKRLGPAVVLGAARYTGEAVPGALALTLELSLTLGRPGTWKTVPLVGEDAVIVSARAGDAPVGVTTQRGYHVWSTQATGEVVVTVELLVPARGPRGSIEFGFTAARTPVTHFDCRFPHAGLEPRIHGAVRSQVTAEPGATRLSATLTPTTRIHLIGFRDLGGPEETPSRVYASTMNLLSVDDSTLELFSVVQYTILYAGAKRFELLIPPGMKVISADGEGAFRYTLEATEGGTLLRGETAVPIRARYEVSLRLSRELQDGDERFDVPLPRPQGVERDVGWVAVEVPGTLRMNEVARGARMQPVDVRQLPAELLRSAVSPILRAYRYHGGERSLALSVNRLPEATIDSEIIDRARAFTVLSDGGTVLTELRLTLRNQLRPSLALDLPAQSQVRSVLLDGAPVKPSRDEAGRVLLPLKRSAGHARSLEAVTLAVVYESQGDGFGWLGSPRVQLPTLELPIASLAWTVFVPGDNVYSATDGASPLLWGRASWREPMAVADARADEAGPTLRPDGDDETFSSADGGAMPVRITLPQAGTRLETERYWIQQGQRVDVGFTYAKRWVRYPAALVLLALALLGAFLAAGRGRSALAVVARVGGAALLAGGVLGVSMVLGGVAASATLLLAAVMATRRRRLVGRCVAGLRDWANTVADGWRAREPQLTREPPLRRVWRGAVGTALAIAALLCLSEGLALLARVVARLT